MGPKLLWNGVPMRSFFGEAESVKIDDSTTLLKVFHLPNWVEKPSKTVPDLVRKAMWKRPTFFIDFSSILDLFLGPPKNHFRLKKNLRGPEGANKGSPESSRTRAFWLSSVFIEFYTLGTFPGTVWGQFGTVFAAFEGGPPQRNWTISHRCYGCF